MSALPGQLKAIVGKPQARASKIDIGIPSHLAVDKYKVEFNNFS